MRAVVQRVTRAAVTLTDGARQSIGPGLVLFVGVRNGDNAEAARQLADKIAALRIFEDDEERLNRSLKEVGGAALVVSNFTLYGDCRKGRRPSFSEAAPPAEASALYDEFVRCLREQISEVATGVFQAKMNVTIENDGPVTLLLDTEKQI